MNSNLKVRELNDKYYKTSTLFLAILKVNRYSVHVLNHAKCSCPLLSANLSLRTN